MSIRNYFILDENNVVDNTILIDNEKYTFEQMQQIWNVSGEVVDNTESVYTRTFGIGDLYDPARDRLVSQYSIDNPLSAITASITNLVDVVKTKEYWLDDIEAHFGTIPTLQELVDADLTFEQIKVFGYTDEEINAAFAAAV